MSEIDTSLFHRNMTPLIRPLRLNSGTLYVFPSASEDIGLNLNMRTNKVALSYYALLDIPPTDTEITSKNIYAPVDVSAEDTYSQNNDSVNRLNFFNIISAANNYVGNTDAYTNSSNTSGDQLSSVKLTASLQNYMMNFETVLMNDADYDYSASATVSEHVFWKWLKETGAIRWKFLTDDVSSDQLSMTDGRPVFEEEDDNNVSVGYKRVVKCFGKISAANSVSNEFGMFNETYVNIPTSYGNSECFFKQEPDDNYKLSHVYTGNSDIYLEGRNAVSNSAVIYTGVNQPFYDIDFATQDNVSQSIKIVDIDDSSDYKNPWQKNSNSFILADKSYVTDIDIISSDISTDEMLNNRITIENDVNNTYTIFKRSKLDAVNLVLDYDELNYIWEKKSADSADRISSYDSFSIDTSLCYGMPDSNYNFEFNAILLYYTIYDKDSNKSLATNLFGILFLNGPQNTSSESGTGTNIQFAIPSFSKRKSSGENSSGEFGTGYSFRVNIKTSEIFDNTDAYIHDNTTSDSLYTEDFNGVVSNLNESVNLIRKQTSLVNTIQNEYIDIITLYNSLSGKVSSLSTQLSRFLQARIDSLDVSAITSKENDTSILKASKALMGEAHINTLDVSTLTVGGTYNYDIPYASISTVDSSLIRSEYFSGDNLRLADSLWKPFSKSKDLFYKSDIPDVSIENIIMDTSIKNDVSGNMFISFDTSSSYPTAFNSTPADDNYFEVDYQEYIPPIIKFLQVLNKNNDENTQNINENIQDIYNKIIDISSRLSDASL